MKWMKKHEQSIGIVGIVLLAIIIFYISFYINENSLTISFIGFFLILILGVFITIFDYKMRIEKRNIWMRTIVFLLVINILFAYMMLVLFSEDIFYFLSFSIIYTLVTLAITWFQDKLREANEKDKE